MSEYRVTYTIASDCKHIGRTYTDFEEAYREYIMEKNNISHFFVCIEKNENGLWVEVPQWEIVKRTRKIEVVKEITISTKGYKYTFTLPKAVEVPSDTKEQQLMYIMLSLLCDTMKEHYLGEKLK